MTRSVTLHAYVQTVTKSITILYDFQFDQPQNLQMHQLSQHKLPYVTVKSFCSHFMLRTGINRAPSSKVHIE